MWSTILQPHAFIRIKASAKDRQNIIYGQNSGSARLYPFEIGGKVARSGKHCLIYGFATIYLALQISAHL